MKTITSIGLIALAVLSPAKAMARGQSNFQDHVRLAQAAQRTGVRVKINPDRCDTEEAYGWYYAAANELVICQENKVKGSNKEMTWTEEDLDTLRHEAHHLVQDCMIRGNRDGILGAVYDSPIELGYRVLGKPRSNRIAELYGNNGASAHIQIMEIEAFAVAALNDPQEQVRDIERYCM